MTTRTAGRAIGMLFLLAFVLYLTGGALVGADSADDLVAGAQGHRVRAGTGALLMAANSAAVLGIGVLALPVLRAHDPGAAVGYLVGRVVEAVLLAVGTALLLVPAALVREGTAPAALGPAAHAAVAVNGHCLQLGMLSLGVAGLLFCQVLWRARLVPRPLAAWGITGYAALLAGATGELLGAGVGVALSVPGGLFEVALGVLLIARGLPGRAPGGDGGPAAAPSPA